ncbi:hypothetical protein BaRGS_00019662 [Batillaria attramentaria]|uniref:Uncharacterized protein n=1 Tax=Batillaria attramentaria TaxID=370345 RepID=A0ABD0KQE8_9CAEN
MAARHSQNSCQTSRTSTNHCKCTFFICNALIHELRKYCTLITLCCGTSDWKDSMVYNLAVQLRQFSFPTKTFRRHCRYCGSCTSIVSVTYSSALTLDPLSHQADKEVSATEQCLRVSFDFLLYLDRYSCANCCFGIPGRAHRATCT